MATNVILVPVDFEDASHRAVDMARDLAARLGAEPVLLHVYQLPVYTYPGLEPGVLPQFTGEVTAAAKRALEKLAGEVGGLRSVLREGDPATEILAAIDDLAPVMVVMGTHGRRGLTHLLLGSVAEKVVRRSHVPVLTVRTAEERKAA